jgi:glycosyltransferase involved in cell wall biosynthesis
VTILYFADTRFPIERANGAQTMATCHALARRGHRVTLVVRPDTSGRTRDPFAFYGLAPSSDLNVLPIAGAATPTLARLRFLASAAGASRRGSGSSVVFTRDLGLASFLLTPLGGRCRRLIYESHGVADVVAAELPHLLGRPDLAPSAAKLRRLARREQRVWSRAACYVTLTTMLASDLRDRFGDRPHVWVVPDGTSWPEAAVPKVVGPDPVVAYAGHLYPWKGVDVLVAALARVPQAHGLIVGGHPAEGDLDRVERLANTLGVRPRMTFTGLVAPIEVARQLESADILVLPNVSSSMSERFTSPLKLFEYMAQGRAIVASDLPAIREVLTDGRTALLVPPGDAGALADAIDRLRRDPGLSLRLATAARAHASNYTWERRAIRLEAALQVAAA